MATDPNHARIEAIGDQLRAKVTSKFQTVAFLGGFALTLLGTQLSILWGGGRVPLLLPYAIGVLVFALLLYAYALTRFNSLTMPKRFWDEASGARDASASHHGLLTDRDLWAIHDRMVFYWTRLVMIAIGATAVSLALILVPLIAPDAAPGLRSALLPAVAAAAIALLYVRLFASEVGRPFAPMQRPRD